MAFYSVSNSITASLLGKESLAADTNTRAISFAASVADTTTYDLVASAVVSGTGTVTIDAGDVATPYGSKGFASVHGILVSVVSGTVEVKQAATSNPLTGCPVFASNTTLGPGFYFFQLGSGATVSGTARNIEFVGTAANATVAVYGVEGSVLP